MSDFNKIVDTLQLYNFKKKEYDGMTKIAFLSCINSLFKDLQGYSEKKGVFYENTLNNILSEFEQFPKYKDLSIFKEFIESNL